MTEFPLPGSAPAVVVAPAPGAGPGYWAGAVADVRYLEVVPLPGGAHRIYYEARLPDESHELRTELIRWVGSSYSSL